MWGVNSTVTKLSDYFVWKNTSERVTGRCNDTCWEEACEFLCIKTFEHIELPAKLLDYFLRSNKSNINHLFFWGSSATKKIAKNPRNCFFRRATNVTSSKFRGWRRKKRNCPRFWLMNLGPAQSTFVCPTAATPLTRPRRWERIRVVRSTGVTVKLLAQIEQHSHNWHIEPIMFVCNMMYICVVDTHSVLKCCFLDLSWHKRAATWLFHVAVSTAALQYHAGA